MNIKEFLTDYYKDVEIDNTTNFNLSSNINNSNKYKEYVINNMSIILKSYSDCLFKELMICIAKNVYTESIFLSPDSNSYIDVIILLDKIAELRGISNEENGLEFNEIIDNLKNI